MSTRARQIGMVAALLLGPVSVVSAVEVTFQVNMSIQTDLGNFAPASDFVEVRGSFNAWGAGFALTNSPGTPHTNVYSATFNIKSAPGTTVPHKFTINDDGWEAGADRTFVLAAAAQTLPVVYYNRVEPVEPGLLTVSAVAAGKFTLAWNARAGVYLQTSSNVVNGVWRDVPNSDGLGSMEFPIGPAPAFFRLASLSPP